MLEKLEVGVLAFETDQGLVYTHPSAWQRVYLLWTFRNFRSLPVKLLNSRQLRLVESLERCDLTCLEPDPENVIGIVEGARISQINVPRAIHVVDSGFRSNLPIHTRIIGATAEISEERAVQRTPPVLHETTRPNSRWNSGLNIAAGAVFVLIALFAFQGLPWTQVWGSIRPPKAITQVLRQAFGSDSTPAGTKNTAVNNVVTNDAQPALNPSSSVPDPAAQTTPVAGITSSDIQLTIPPQTSPVPDSTPVDTTQAENELDKPVPHDGSSEPRMTASIGEQMEKEESSPILVSRPPLKLIYPQYPASGVRGKVEMKAIIDADGHVEAVKVLSGPRILSAEAERAVKKWHYDPYLKDGEPVATETNVRILFVAADVISISFPESLSTPE